MRVAWVFLLLTVAMSAQAPPNPVAQRTQQPAGPRASVAGVIVNALTGEPLKRTNVALRSTMLMGRGEGAGNMQLTSTDTEGKFLFQNVEPGRYRLLASRNGFIAQAYGQRDASAASNPFMEQTGAPITVGPGQEIKDILFRLTPAGAISGRVVDEDGQPILGAEVQALRWTYARGRRQLVRAGGASTDDRGEYRIFRLNPGRYYLSATYDVREDRNTFGPMRWGISGGGTGPAEVYPPSFYPGTTDLTQAAAVELRGGDDVPGINFTLALQRAVRVSGRVFNAITGQPARRVHVSLAARTLTMRAFISGDQDVTTDEQGAFRIGGIAPGSYTLMAEWDGEGQGPGTIITSETGGRRTVVYGRRHYAGRLQLEIGSADIDNANLTISPGTEVAGTLRIEGTIGSASGRPNPNQVRILLEATDDLSIGMLSTIVKPDGTFVFDNVPDDTYRVNFGGLGDGAYLKSARMANQDVLEDGLLMTRGRRGPLDLVVSLAAGRVEGTVLDAEGRPFMGARVALVPEGGRRKIPNLFRSATTDDFGHFSIRSVPPGDYKLFAWDNIEAGAYQDTEFLRPFEDFGQLISVNEGSQSSAELKLIVAENRGQ